MGRRGTDLIYIAARNAIDKVLQERKITMSHQRMEGMFPDDRKRLQAQRQRRGVNRQLSALGCVQACCSAEKKRRKRGTRDGLQEAANERLP